MLVVLGAMEGNIAWVAEQSTLKPRNFCTRISYGGLGICERSIGDEHWILYTHLAQSIIPPQPLVLAYKIPLASHFE